MSKMRMNIKTARENAKVKEMFPSLKPEPMTITFKSEKDLPISPSGRLRACSECAHSTTDCTYCQFLHKPIFPYQYACFNFITDEEEIKRREEAAIKRANEISQEWSAKQKVEEVKCNWLLTLMLDMIVGSQILLEDFERRSDYVFKNNPFPDSKVVQDHKSDKDWIFKHKYAFNTIYKTLDRMKKEFDKGCSMIRTTFETTIQKHIVGMCTDPETKKLDVEKYTSIDTNAAEITRLMMLVMNKVVGTEGNFEKIVDFIAQLEGKDVFSPQDITRFKIK